ncbi:MAG: homoserine dehydrogenase [Candidatus Micrarchaeota archaeon]
MTKDVRVIIVGFGAIGKGVASALLLKNEELARNYGISVRVVGICEYNGCILNKEGIALGEVLQLASAGKLSEHPNWSTQKSTDAIREAEADATIEVTPGNIQTGEPGLANILAALDSGKHVITSNKSPIALRFWELTKRAEEKNLQLKYEATVCGGMPTFNMAKSALQANRILSIRGILNGTTNFILTKMHEENLSFASALQQAKEQSIAEPDPTYDVEAIDPAVKLVILASALVNSKKTYADVKRVGITQITPEAVALAKENGFRIKLIGEIDENGNLSVAPRLIPHSHPLNVSGTLNALMLKTDMAREVFVMGRGAGPMETSSSILSDLVSIFAEK